MERVFIGNFGVDSGQVMIGDPASLGSFINDDYGDNSIYSYSYSGACEATLSSRRGGVLYNEHSAGVAVAVSTGGDGVFPVYATIDNGMITKIEIDLTNN